MSAREGGGSLRKYLRPAAIALIAAIAYGTWAAIAHNHHDPSVAIRAGLTQAALTLTATLVLVTVSERLFRLPADPVRGFWLASFATSMLSGSWLALGHLFMGTPRVVAAITPSLVIGTTLYFFYARLLLIATRRTHPGP